MHGPHFDDQPTSHELKPGERWWHLLNRYHWFVLTVAALGWLFDCLDQQLFNLARMPAMRELLAPAHGQSALPGDVDFFGGLSTSIFLIGWATGGIFFGILGDRIGRAKTMMITILCYSAFTGLSALSQGFWDFAFYRFLTGLGVGGEFAVGVALVAEVMPDRARPFALGLLQALSTVGNVSAAFISIGLGQLEESGAIGSAWRWMFVIGALPAVLAVIIRWRLKEPERWQQAVETGKKQELGSISELFGDPRWRKRAIVGMLLASAGVIGLWGIGFFSIDLIRTVFTNSIQRELREEGEAESDRQFVAAIVANPALLNETVAISPAETAPSANAAAGAEAVSKTVAEIVQPSNLLAPEARNRDAETLFAAVLELHKAKKPINANSVVFTALNLQKTAVSHEQLTARRSAYEQYLRATPPANFSAAESALHISSRASAVRGRVTMWAGITSLMLNIGAFFGITSFTRVSYYIGRRPAFAIAFIIAALSTAMVFLFISGRTVTIAGFPIFVDVLWMIPLMGFCQLSIFGGYAIYFPELFPTRLRSTGTSFCYNVGRFVAAIGPYFLGYLSSSVFGHMAEPMRYAGVTMCSIFLIGLLALPFAPETRGKPLPE